MRSSTLTRPLLLSLACLLAVLCTGALELLPRAAAPETWCCCADTGVNARCKCDSDCCRHEPVPVTYGEPAPAPAPGITCLAAQCRRPGAPAHVVPTLEPFVAPAAWRGATPARAARCLPSRPHAPAARALPTPQRPPANPLA